MMHLKNAANLLLLCLAIVVYAHTHGQTLDSLLSAHQQRLGSPVTDLAAHHTQIIWSEVGKGRRFHTQTFGVPNDHYFYPASTVKLPVAVLALEWLQKHYPQIQLTDRIHFGHVSERLRERATSDTHPSCTLEQLLKLIFVVSDNDAYNRIFEIVGPDYVNERMRRLGCGDTRIIHRVGVGNLSLSDRTTLPQVIFLRGQDTIAVIPKRHFTLPPPLTLPNLRQGKGFYSGDSLIMQSFDFSERNWFALPDQHRFLQLLFMPEKFRRRHRLRLTDPFLQVIKRAMRMLPHEAGNSEVFQQPAGYCKFFIGGGDADKLPKGIEIYNKVGEAYGYLIDNAFIRDTRTGRQFFLSAVVHVNADGIFNDDAYEYDAVGFPFLKWLGYLIWEGKL